MACEIAHVGSALAH